MVNYMTHDFTKLKTLHDEGVDELRRHNIKRAISLLEKARKLAPTNASVRNNLGTAYAKEGGLKKAEQSFYKATKIDPSNPEYSYNLANCLYLQKRYIQAIKPIEATLNLKYDHFQARCLQINILLEINELDNLLEHASDLFNIFPENSTSIHLLALSLITLGKYDIAVELLCDSLKTFQNNFELYEDLGIAYNKLNNYDKAILFLEKALLLNRQSPSILTNLGNAYLSKFDFENAKINFQRSIHVSETHAQGYVGLAMLELYKKDAHKSINMLETALNKNPHSALARFYKAQVLLATGNYVEGTEYYESRFNIASFIDSKREYNIPLYDGRKLNFGEKVFIWSEQGIGDEIFFAKFIRSLSKIIDNIVIDCDPRLVDIFKRSFPNIEVVNKDDKNITIETDFQIPMGSLPRILKYNIADLYQIDRLIKPNANHEKLREKYQKMFPGKKIVGISWKTTNQATGHLRTIPIELWDKILADNNSVFINLQYNDTTSTDKIYNDDSINPMENLDNFISQVAACDLIITIDNSTAHIAAALMKPTWCMVPLLCDWRYGLNGNKTFWYNSMRIYRQAIPNSWDDVILNITIDLEDINVNMGLG